MTKKFKRLSEKLDAEKVKKAEDRHTAIKNAEDGQLVDVITATLDRKKKASNKKISKHLESIDDNAHALWETVETLTAGILLTLVLFSAILVVATLS